MNNQPATADELLGQTTPVEVETMTEAEFRRFAIEDARWDEVTVGLILRHPPHREPVEIGGRVIRIEAQEK